MTQILIGEDEIASSDHLVTLLEESKMPFEILNIISSVEGALKWLKDNTPPDLIFMDIHLSDGKSFEIFKSFSISSPVIFVTAYDDYAIQAFKTTGIDYLLKPIDTLDLKVALSKYLDNKLLLYGNLDQSLKYMVHKSTVPEQKERFLVKEGSEYIPIKTVDVAYFYRSTVVFIKMFNGKSYLINYSLSQLEHLLPQHLFIRLNRQIIANVNAIESFAKRDSSYFVKLRPVCPEDMSISQESYANLKRVLS